MKSSFPSLRKAVHFAEIKAVKSYIDEQVKDDTGTVRGVWLGK
jgi:hypothetical protein